MYFDDGYDEPTHRDPALVCENGHRISGHAQELVPLPKYCEECGAATMHKCKSCDAPVLGDWPNATVLGVVSPPAHCTNCGKPYPWRLEALQRAERTARMQAEIHDLDSDTREELNRFTLSVAQNKVTEADVSTFGRWFKKKAGLEAAKAIGGALKDIATDVIATAIAKSLGA